MDVSCTLSAVLLQFPRGCHITLVQPLTCRWSRFQCTPPPGTHAARGASWGGSAVDSWERSWRKQRYRCGNKYIHRKLFKLKPNSNKRFKNNLSFTSNFFRLTSLNELTCDILFNLVFCNCFLAFYFLFTIYVLIFLH